MSLDDGLLVDPLDQPDHPRCLKIPQHFYWILEQPTPLAGMSDPRWTGVGWDELWECGFRAVVCLSQSQPAYDPFPLNIAWCGDLEDLFGSRPPRDPAGELLKIKQAAAAVVEELAANRGVVVQCLGGIGRTGTVLAATLVRLGLDAVRSIAHIEDVNVARGHHWPEADWHLEAIEQSA